MTFAEYYNNKIPDYYHGMYRDGYTPQQVLYSAHRKMKQMFIIQPEAEQDELWNIQIISEVKIK